MEKKSSKNRGDSRLSGEQKLIKNMKKGTSANARLSASDGEKSAVMNLSSVECTKAYSRAALDSSKAQPNSTTAKSVIQPRKRESRENSDSSTLSDGLLSATPETCQNMISTIELMMETTSSSRRIERLTSTIEQLGVDVNYHKEILEQTKLEIEQLKKENQMLRAGVAENKRNNQGRY